MYLAHDRRGEGPTLILLHPLGADRRVWDPVLDRLAAQREVITVDLPGFGGSPPLRETPTPRAIANTVAEFIGRLGLGRTHVAGNSLGGWVTLELALTGRALSATAIAPAGLWPEPLIPKGGAARTLARAALPVLDRLACRAAGRRLLLAGVVARPERVPGPAAVHLIRSYVTAPGFRAANDAMRSQRFQGLERIRVPVTLVWPQRDRLVARPSWIPTTVRNYALEGCGHIPMWDAPGEVARILIDASEPR